MKRSTTKMSQFTLVIAFTMLAAGCSEKTTSTQIQPDGSQTTTVTDKKPWGTTTETVTKPAPQQEDESPNQDQAKVNVTVDKDTAGDVEKIHVRGPGIKIDTSDNDEHVDIKVPFVNVHRDGKGKINVKTPFVNIDTNEN